MHDGTNTVGSSDSPFKECYTDDRHDDCLCREEMADRLDGEPVKLSEHHWFLERLFGVGRNTPDSRKRPHPENEESHKVARISPRTHHGIVEVIERGPDGSNHQYHTTATNPGLHSIPNAGHGRTVENEPE